MTRKENDLRLETLRKKVNCLKGKSQYTGPQSNVSLTKPLMMKNHKINEN